MNSKDELYYSAIDLLHRLIRTPSISREEDAAAQIICETLQKNRFTPYRAGNNVWTFAREFDSEKPTVLLNSHIDTVKPTDSWSRPPFVPIEEDNRLYGLGSNDAGASVVSLLSAFIHLSETEQPYNLVFLASAEEEVSGQNGIVKTLEQLPTIDFAVVGEPTGMQPAVCEKGLLVLDCSTHGKSGHAARNEGINALYKATETIEALRTFEFPLASDLLGKVRTNDRYTNAEAVEILKSRFPEVEITPRSLRLNSSAISMQHPFVRRALLAGYKPFGSPTLSDQALMPFPSVKMGPGDSSRSHTADEYIILEEIREAIEVYICLLDRLQIEKSAQ